MNKIKTYCIDKSMELDKRISNIKYIAKSYNEKGEIQYYEEDQPEDGFRDIIKDLQAKKVVILYTSQKRMKATLEFLNELKFSVEATILTIIFKDEEHKWTEVKYEY